MPLPTVRVRRDGSTELIGTTIMQTSENKIVQGRYCFFYACVRLQLQAECSEHLCPSAHATGKVPPILFALALSAIIKNLSAAQQMEITVINFVVL